jgi:probable rRNA maturation factor
VNVQVFQDQQDLPISEASVKALVTRFNAFHRVVFDEVTIHFVDTPAICDLHDQFFQDPSPTDCISFPMDSADEEGYKIMGDVFVCPETARQFVEVHGGNIYEEITLYIVHGLLHLLGFDDLSAEDEQVMRAEEARFLKFVKENNLWLTA